MVNKPKYIEHVLLTALSRSWVLLVNRAGRFQPACLYFNALGHSSPSQSWLGNRLFLANVTMPLRVSELCDLQWNQIDFQSAAIHIRRVKRGTPATHPLTGNEMRALRKLKSENEASLFVFVSELGTPFTTMGFSQMLKRAAEKAGLDIKVHAHMLRHACGFKLANDGVDTRSLQSYLGQKNIQHTVRYTELSPNRFKDFWKDYGHKANLLLKKPWSASGAFLYPRNEKLNPWAPCAIPLHAV